MAQLIEQIRGGIPFDLPDAVLCSGLCRGCSKKLLDFLDQDLEYWELQLKTGGTPSFGDIQRLARRARKIRTALERNGLVPHRPER